MKLDLRKLIIDSVSTECLNESPLEDISPDTEDVGERSGKGYHYINKLMFNIPGFKGNESFIICDVVIEYRYYSLDATRDEPAEDDLTITTIDINELEVYIDGFELKIVSSFTLDLHDQIKGYLRGELE